MPLADVHRMIAARKLAAKGIGSTDAHLIGSCLATPGTQIWTLDGRLDMVAESLRMRTLPLSFEVLGVEEITRFLPRGADLPGRLQKTLRRKDTAEQAAKKFRIG